MKRIKSVQIDVENDIIVLDNERGATATTIKDGVKRINDYLQSIPKNKLDFPDINKYTKYGKLDVKIKINNAHTLTAVLAVLYLKGYKWYDEAGEENQNIPKEAPYLFIKDGLITYSLYHNNFALFSGFEMPVTKVFELAMDIPFAQKGVENGK